MKIKIIRDHKKGLMTPEKVLDLVAKGEIAPGRAINYISDRTKGRGKAVENDTTVNVNREEEILAELDRLVGLEPVKKVVHEIRAYVKIQKLRREEKLLSEPQVLHCIFKGNPGTGKTTVARIIGKLFKEMNVLTKGHVLEVERADLVGEYIGHTAQKTREQFQKAVGGVLFIDEAYSLARGGEKDFGKEAIDVMVKAMEDHKDCLILILAGYQEEMEAFLRTNPGLRSRFAIHIDFPDFNLDELIEIANLMLGNRQYKLSAAACDCFKKTLQYETAIHEHQGNARLVRNIIEKAIRMQAVRLVKKTKVSRDELITILPEDIEGARDQWLRSVL